MSLEDARRIVGNDTKANLRRMVVALRFHSWNNTPAEAERLVAALVVLRSREVR